MIPNFSVEVAIIIERITPFHDFNKMMKIVQLPSEYEGAFKQLSSNLMTSTQRMQGKVANLESMVSGH